MELGSHVTADEQKLESFETSDGVNHKSYSSLAFKMCSHYCFSRTNKLVARFVHFVFLSGFAFTFMVTLNRVTGCFGVLVPLLFLFLFSICSTFKDDNDELRRSPGTPVFTAPECCLGLTYHGKAADTWALGVTLYCMVLGEYPFLGETLQDTYDKIVNNPLSIPEGTDPHLKGLLEGILCKDPEHRLTLEAVAEHPWVVDEEGPLLEYVCYCKRRGFYANSCLTTVD